MEGKLSVKQKEQIIIVVTVSALVLMFIGISYAYFTAVNNERSGSSIVAVGGKMLINYDDETDDIKPVTNIKPSNAILVDKTFTLTGTNTTKDLTMPYKVGLKYTSTFSNGQIHYYIKEINRPANSNVTTNYVITPAEGKTEADYINQTVPGNASKTGYVHGTLKNGNRYTEMVTGEFSASTDDQTITFNLILQFPDNNENQDSEKGATINGKIVINKEASFLEDSWEEIADNVKNGKDNLYKIGDEKEVEINGTSYTVRVANNSTPEECSGDDFSQTACGFVIEFVDIIEDRAMNSSQTNKGGWPATAMRTYLNGDFYNSLPEDLRNVIIDTKVISGHGSTSGETNFTSTDKIYLLSGHEIYEDGTSSKISTYDTAYNNTRQLDYYKNKGVTTSSYSGTIKKKTGSSSGSEWWLRAAISSYNDSFLIVGSKGGWYGTNANHSGGVSPAFRIG